MNNLVTVMYIGIIGLILGLIIDIVCKMKKVKNKYKFITYISFLLVVISSIMMSQEEASTITNYFLPNI